MVRRQPNQYKWDALQFDQQLLTKHFTPMPSKKVEFIVFHHMVILDKFAHLPDALDRCYSVWQTRRASAGYGVDRHFVRQYVLDKDRSWSLSNGPADRKSISIEMANETLDLPGTANDYKVAEETWKTAAKLGAYLHKRYGLGRPTRKTCRQHNEFAPTACPGQYVKKNFDKIIKECQRVYDEITKVGAPPKPVPPSNPEKDLKKTLDQIVAEVIAGKWGNGATRKTRLTKAGYNYSVVQNAVNNALKGKATPKVTAPKKTPAKPKTKYTNAQVADQIVRGVGGWGNNPGRAKKLRAQGYDAAAVQRLVNQKMRKK